MWTNFSVLTMIWKMSKKGGLGLGMDWTGKVDIAAELRSTEKIFPREFN